MKLLTLSLAIGCLLDVALAGRTRHRRQRLGNEEDDVVFWKAARLLASGLYFDADNVTVESEPQFEMTEFGASVKFDGIDDRILVDSNPIFGAVEFTIETLVFPFSDGATLSPEPRYLHVESPDDSNRRITMELRVVEGGLWYFDAFIKSEVDQFTLIDPDLTHPTEEWYHLAITYTTDGLFTSYVNGVEELNTTVTYLPIAENGRVSLGARMNQVHYLSGLIDGAIFTARALTPEEFSIPYII